MCGLGIQTHGKRSSYLDPETSVYCTSRPLIGHVKRRIFQQVREL